MNLRRISVGLMAVVVTLSMSGIVKAATQVNLGTATSFAVLAGTAVTNIPLSNITGDVGLSPAAGSNYAGLTAAEVIGTIYDVNGTGPGGSVNNPGLLTNAKNDLTAAYIDAAGQPVTTALVAADNQLGGQTLIPGVYSFGTAATANLIGTLTLDAQGDPDAVFIFQASADLVTASNSVVQMINGGQACNVFWQVTSSATLGTTTTFVGSILALTSIADNGSSNVNGRLLARNGAVTLSSTTIIVPACAVSGTGTGTGGSTGGSLAGTSGDYVISSTIGIVLVATVASVYVVPVVVSEIRKYKAK